MAAPTLYWYSTAASDARLDFSLLARQADGSTEPVAAFTVAPHVEAGIGSLSLSDRGIELEPGVVYRWYVAAVMDPERRAQDVVAGAAVERVPRGELQLRTGLQAAAAYAREGYWYDALDAVQEALADLPDSPDPPDQLERARGALLTQVGITTSER